ncbi:hypothetical protein QBC41DRAFT_334342 [Cercophora samala]|uniref:Uncharacterized protein n=1 Tax=Cercophora samala TaxID=330535 RepID=A0AA39ZKY9_9PEZI|nr:hypothetical protein QBC41DRAFT_334342 [Cercophora samala]
MQPNENDERKGLDSKEVLNQETYSNETDMPKTDDNKEEVSGETDIPMAVDISDDEFTDYELFDCESGEEANGDESEEICKFLCEHAPKVRKALDEAAEKYGPIIRAQIAEDKARKAAQRAAKVQQMEKERRARFTPEEIAKRRRKNERERERRKRRKAVLAAAEQVEMKERRERIRQKIKERRLEKGEESDVEFILEYRE